LNEKLFTILNADNKLFKISRISGISGISGIYKIKWKTKNKFDRKARHRCLN